jgi:hypothetical protein
MHAAVADEGCPLALGKAAFQAALCRFLGEMVDYIGLSHWFASNLV